MSSNPRHAEDLLRIMDLCTGDLTAEWTVGMVAERLGLSMSKTSRLLNSIAGHGYMDKSLGGTYRVGKRLLVISRAADLANSMSQKQIERDAMAALR